MKWLYDAYLQYSGSSVFLKGVLRLNYTITSPRVCGVNVPILLHDAVVETLHLSTSSDHTGSAYTYLHIDRSIENKIVWCLTALL